MREMVDRESRRPARRSQGGDLCECEVGGYVHSQIFSSFHEICFHFMSWANSGEIPTCCTRVDYNITLSQLFKSFQPYG